MTTRPAPGHPGYPNAAVPLPSVSEGDWLTFPGGELEGRRPRALCGACREALARSINDRLDPRSSHGANGAAAPSGQAVLCFQCHRLELERERRLKAAGELDTASEARFQGSLPYEPVNRARLDRLRVERVSASAAAKTGPGQYVDRRRQAQIAARHALQRIVAGLKTRNLAKSEETRVVFGAMHAAELQLPDSWLPFVSAR